MFLYIIIHCFQICVCIMVLSIRPLDRTEDERKQHLLLAMDEYITPGLTNGFYCLIINSLLYCGRFEAHCTGSRCDFCLHIWWSVYETHAWCCTKVKLNFIHKHKFLTDMVIISFYALYTKVSGMHC